MKVRTLLGGAAALVLIGGLTAPSATAQEAGSADHTSQEVIEGVFFGLGPVGEEVEATVQLPDEISQEDYEAQVETFTAELQEADAETFDSVADGLTSGSPVEVQESLEQGTDLMNEVAGTDDVPEDEQFVQPRCGVAGAFCVAVAAVGGLSWVVAQNSVAATTVAGVTQAVVAWNGMYTPNASTAEADLDHERSVAYLAEQLG